MRSTCSEGPRIAFFGGSFDPPHLGHIAVARAAMEALRLDGVLFAPVGFEDRVAMTRLAIEGEEGFAVSLIDAPRPAGKPNYTLDTLLRLSEESPAVSQLFCLMGADSLGGLRLWHRAEEVPFAAEMIVASRPGQSLNDLKDFLPEGLKLEAAECVEARSVVEMRCYLIGDRTGRSAPFYLLPGLAVGISASAIRNELRMAHEGDGAAVRELLPAAVEAYVREHGLYR
jgi:nicotinate-nucleotide adenylyltransferase